MSVLNQPTQKEEGISVNYSLTFSIIAPSVMETLHIRNTKTNYTQTILFLPQVFYYLKAFPINEIFIYKLLR